MSFAERVGLLITRFADGNQTRFARMCGLDPGSIRQYLAGKKPTLDSLVAIANACDVSLDWLAMGRGQESYTQEQGRLAWIPLLAFRASAGTGSLVIDEETDARIPIATDLLRQLRVRPDHLRAIHADGDSMSPTIEHGDLLVIDTSQKDLIEGRIHLFTIGQEAFLKRLIRAPGHRLIMRSDNSSYRDEPVPTGEPLAMIGQVVWGGHRL